MVDFLWRPHPGPQTEFCSSGEFEVLYGGQAGPGKMQPLSSLIATPFGFRELEDVRVGSIVSTPFGQSRVIATYDFKKRKIYRIGFSDGTFCEAGDEHLWLAWRSSVYSKKLVGFGIDFFCPDKSKIYTTENMIPFLKGRNKPIVPLTYPVAFAPGRKKTQVDPYLLGVLLGDGGLSRLDQGPIKLTSWDDELVESLKTTFEGRISGGPREFLLVDCAELRKALRAYGLTGTRSDSKFIPTEYLSSSVIDRFRLMQGLMDTDGSADSRDGHIEYTTVSKALSRDAVYVLRSLGFKVSISEKQGSYKKNGRYIACKKAYRLSIQGRDTNNLFFLERKKAKCRAFNGGFSIPGKRIVSIESIGEKAARCIRIDDPRGLYLTDDFTVTHNTDCLIAEATRYVTKPNYHGLILRRTFPQLSEIIDRTRNLYPSIGGNYKAGEHKWYFPSGARISLGHIQHDGDEYNYQGKEFQFIGFDEACQFLPSQYLYLFSRCRSADPDIPCRVRAASNPGGPGHVFLKNRFKIGNVAPNMTVWDTYVFPGAPLMEISRRFIPGKLSDNPSLLENDPMYIARLMMLPEIERKRLLEGDWSIFSGQALPELNIDIHGFTVPDPLPPGWSYYGSFDWGYSKPWCYGVWAVTPDDRLILVAMIYGAKKDDGGNWVDVGLRQSDAEISREILALNRKLGVKIQSGPADPSIWNPKINKKGHTGPSTAEEMSREGVNFIPADNDRLNGKRQIHNRLELDEEGRPWVYFNRELSAFWETVPFLCDAENGKEDFEKPQPHDHVIDMVRYFLMSRPMKARVETPQQAVGSFQYERNRMLRAKKIAQRRGYSLEQAYRMAG